MAETKKTAAETAAGGTTAESTADIVELFVDRDPSDENPNMVIIINGKTWVMPRGESSKVPRYVYDEYQRAKKAQYKADKTAASMRGVKEAK